MEEDSEYNEDDYASVDNLDYRSAALLKGTTYSEDTEFDIRKSSQIDKLGDLMCLDYFRPIYRSPSKVEKIVYLFEF